MTSLAAEKNTILVPLILGVVAGFLIIGFFGFAADAAILRFNSYSDRAHALNHWKSWEFAALAWNVIFDGIIYWTFPFPSPANHQRWHPGAVRMVSFVLIAGVGTCTLFAMSSLWGGSPTHHLFFVLGIAACFTLVDGLLLVLIGKHDEHGRIFEKTLWMADIPMLVAFLSLFAFQCIHTGCKGTTDADFEIFSSGAISFQLVAQNVIFGVIQIGALRSVSNGPVGQAGA